MYCASSGNEKEKKADAESGELKSESMFTDDNSRRLFRRERRIASVCVFVKEANGEMAEREECVNEAYERMPDLIQCCDVLTFGVPLWAFCLTQLQVKDRSVLWDILCHFAAMLPTQLIVKLIEENRGILSKFELHSLDRLCSTVIESAKFPAATALYLAAFMKERSQNDLSRQQQLNGLCEKYVEIATQLLQQIESDHLLAMVCEIPSDIDSLSIFDISLKFKMDTFLDFHRLAPVVLQLWYRVDFLNPAKPFPQIEWNHRQQFENLAKHPIRFYYSGLGQFVTSTLLYMSYLAFLSYVTYTLDGYPYEELKGKEMFLWACNMGYASYELIECYIHGIDDYLASMTNRFDLLVAINWILLLILRLFLESEFVNDADSKSDRIKLRNKDRFVFYMVLWSVQLVLLWCRLALVLRRTRSIGSLLTMIGKMVTDILNFLVILSLLTMGFVFSLIFIIGPDLKKDCVVDGGIELWGMSDIILYIFQSLLGQQEWVCR